jgi:hypothetical protein
MDPFALLSSGARFDKRKQPGSVSRPPGSFSVAQPLPEQQQQQQPSRKKRKKQQGAAASGEKVAIDADTGFSLFGGSPQQAQVQQQQQQQQQLEAALPEVHTRDPQEEANVIRKALRIKVRADWCLLLFIVVVQLSHMSLIAIAWFACRVT